MDTMTESDVKTLLEKELAEFEVGLPDNIEKLPGKFDELHKKFAPMAEKLPEMESELAKLLATFQQVEQMVKSLANNAPKEVIVKFPDLPKKPKHLKLVHRQFDVLLRCVMARDTNGYPLPVWGYGAPGAGKSHLAYQMAMALGVEFYPISFGPTTTDSKVVGFQSAAQGKYVLALGRDWYENGGFFFCDEADNAEPSAAISLNALAANHHYRFPDGKLIEKHKNCYLFAGANTLGTGATQGFRRQSQDAAFRNRWGKIKIEYDEALEAQLAPCKPWVEYVQKVRASVEKMAKTSVWITPRDSIIGSAWLLQGIPAEVVVEHLFCELAADARKQVISECGKFTWNPNKKN